MLAYSHAVQYLYHQNSVQPAIYLLFCEVHKLIKKYALMSNVYRSLIYIIIVVDMGTAGQVFVQWLCMYGEWEWEQPVYKMLSPVSGVTNPCRIINLRHTRALLGLKWPLNSYTCIATAIATLTIKDTLKIYLSYDMFC